MRNDEQTQYDDLPFARDPTELTEVMAYDFRKGNWFIDNLYRLGVYWEIDKMDDTYLVSGDISWMLQSGRVSDRALAEALVTRYQARLSRLAVRLSGPPTAAETVQVMVIDTLAQAVAYRHEYWGREALERWLAERMLKRCRKMGKDCNEERIIDEENSLVDRVLKSAEDLRAQSRRRVQIWQAVFGLGIVLFFAGLAASIRWLPDTTRDPTSEPVLGGVHETGGRPGSFVYHYRVNKDDTIDDIVRRTGVSIEQIEDYNFLYRPYLIREGAVLQMPSGVNARTVLEEAARGSIEPNPMLEAKLTERSTAAEVYDRFRHMQTGWNSLRATLFWVEYGSPGYSGPVQKMTQYVLLMRGPDLWTVVNAEYGSGYSTASYYMKDMVFLRLAGDDRIFGEFQTQVRLLDFLPIDLYGQAGLSSRLVGESIAAGRPAVIVETEFSNYLLRYWFDSVTAFPLRVQMISLADQETVISELVTTSIQYDQTVPIDYFDPGRELPSGAATLVQSFGAAAATEQIPGWLTGRGIPVGAAANETTSVGAQPVTLLLPDRWDMYLSTNIHYPRELAAEEILVYAGQTLLGTVETAYDRLISCLRSPDGSSLALIGSSENIDSLGSLIWLSLDDMDEAESLSAITIAYTYSFSPDGEELALAGCFHETGCGIYLYRRGEAMDTAPLFVLEAGIEPVDILWAADGRQVAFTYREVDAVEGHCGLMAVDTANGKITGDVSLENCSGGINALTDLGYQAGKSPEFDGCKVP